MATPNSAAFWTASVHPYRLHAHRFDKVGRFGAQQHAVGVGALVLTTKMSDVGLGARGNRQLLGSAAYRNYPGNSRRYSL
jgi:hypothetical protein